MHNQTEQPWIENLEPDALGTGILLLPDETRSPPVRKIFVRDITYEQCMQRGKDAVNFKWVPHKIDSYEDLLNETCNVPTPEEEQTNGGEEQ